MENRGPQLQAVAVFLLALAIVSFSLRTYVRTRMVKVFGVDDWLMTLATATYSVYTTCVLVGVHYGTGRHSADLEPADERMALQFWFYCYIWYSWTMMLSKLSIGIFLQRIIISWVHLWILYFAMIINIVTGLVFFFLTMMQCQPVSYFWDKINQSGWCISIDIIIVLTFLYSALNILCDFTFALLPVVIVQGLNMPSRMKIAIVPLLSMGCIASSAVVVRLAYVKTFRDDDFLYATVDIAIWSTVECGLAITAGSLACVKPLFRAIFHRLSPASELHQFPSNDLLGGQHPATIGSNRKRRRQGDVFSLGSLFSCRDADIEQQVRKENGLKAVPPTRNGMSPSSRMSAAESISNRSIEVFVRQSIEVTVQQAQDAMMPVEMTVSKDSDQSYWSQRAQKARGV